MIRGVLSALSRKASLAYFKLPSNTNGVSFITKSLITQQNSFTSLVPAASPLVTSKWVSKYTKHVLLQSGRVSSEQIRTLIKYSLKKGKRKTVRPVLKRFFRLNWGIWIRTIAGRNKKLWKKSAGRRNRLLHHVFCNATQCRLLDKMVNKFWRKPRYYIDDPYAPYQKRENFYITRQKPWRPEGVDYE